MTYNGLYALNASTGALIWKYATGLLPVQLAGGGKWRGLCRCPTRTYMLSTPHGRLAVDIRNRRLDAMFRRQWRMGWSMSAARNAAPLRRGCQHGRAPLELRNAVTGSLFAGGGQRHVVHRSRRTGYLYAFGLPNQQMSEKFSPPERPDPARLTPNWSTPAGSQITPPLKK